MKEIKKTGKVSAEKNLRKLKGEEYVAIGMALYSYFGELHDKESDVITIKRNYRDTSEWCSKIFNMRNLK
jgi:glutaconyl-CoA/methylmalonyl-CoA decarboxylase subunit delta